MCVCVIVFYHIIVPCVCVCGLFPAPTRWGLRDRKNKLRVCRRDECADVLTSFHLLYVLRTTPSYFVVAHNTSGNVHSIQMHKLPFHPKWRAQKKRYVASE